MSDSDVKSGGRKAAVILLDGDVTRLHIGTSYLVLLFNHNRGETSTSSGMSKNVSDVIVAKHQRRTIVTTNCVISEDVHL